jgi:hypothetical protein
MVLMSNRRGRLFPHLVLGEKKGGEGIANPGTGESSEVAVYCPELVDSVFDRQCCSLSVMDEVAGGGRTSLATSGGKIKKEEFEQMKKRLTLIPAGARPAK